MKRLSATGIALGLVLSAAPGLAQVGGNLPQVARKGMEATILRMEQMNMVASAEVLEKSLGAERLRAFLDGAVVKVRLEPDGTFSTYTRPGGEITGVSLGRKDFDVSEDGGSRDGWVVKTGEYAVPSKAQDVALQLDARGQQVTVECENKYRESDQPVTYYVGPMNGLFCFGITGETETAIAK